MAITSLPPFGLFPPTWFAGSPGAFAFSTNVKHSTIVRIPRSGTIDRVQFYPTAAASNQPIKLSFQTRDSSTGMPTGTNYGGSLPITHTVTINQYNTPTFTTPATGTPGDYLCCVMEWDSTVGNLQFQQANSTASYAELAIYNGTTWARTTNSMFLHPMYNDGSYFETGALVSRNVSTNYLVASSPDEVGVMFKVPVPLRFFGAQTNGTLTSAIADAVLYDDVNTELAKLRQYATNPNLNFTDAPIFDPARYYRLTWRPVSGTVSQFRAVFPSAAAKAEFFNPGLFDVQMTTRTDLGAWTQTALEIPYLLPIFDGVDMGTSGAPRGVLSLRGI